MALKVGVSPETGLLFASFKVIVTVDVSTPSAMTGPEPVMVEVAATAPPGVKVTVPSALMKGVAIERVFTSAVSEASVHVETPEAFEAEHVP